MSDAFCEVCGLDAEAPRADWSVVIGPDRAYYERTGAPVDFPADCPVRWFRLDTDDVTIGRRSVTRGLTPTIDLSGPPEDPAVSHAHARLTKAADGSYELVDIGSTNGTRLNDGSIPLVVGEAVRLGDGDRIHLGAWTTITVHGPSSPR